MNKVNSAFLYLEHILYNYHPESQHHEKISRRLSACTLK